MIDPNIVGRIALITGANCGIGEASARLLAAQGVGVLLTFLRFDASQHTDDPGTPAEYWRLRARSCDEIVRDIQSTGGRAEAIETDLTDADSLAALFDQAESLLGPVDILVHNASSWLADTFLPSTPDRFGRTHERVSAASHDRQFAVDARAGALLIAEYARRHRTRDADWGRIIALTSAGVQGFPGEVSYGAAKAALESYIRSAALELGRFGITANLVHPPATDTGWITPEIERSVLESSPIRHVGRPQEVAEVIVFLASEQAQFVTGNTVRMH